VTNRHASFISHHRSRAGLEFAQLCKRTQSIQARFKDRKKCIRRQIRRILLGELSLLCCLGSTNRQPSGPIESTHCLYETVESLNAKLFPAVKDLVKYPFFRHYKVDLFRECPFWYENGFCMNRDCGVETADEVSYLRCELSRWADGSLKYLRNGGRERCLK